MVCNLCNFIVCEAYSLLRIILQSQIEEGLREIVYCHAVDYFYIHGLCPTDHFGDQPENGGYRANMRCNYAIKINARFSQGSGMLFLAYRSINSFV